MTESALRDFLNCGDPSPVLQEFLLFPPALDPIYEIEDFIHNYALSQER